MVEEMDEEQIREQAEKSVRQRMHLLEHLGTYVVINGFLVLVWALTGAGYPWFLWVMVAWGLGLALNIVSYFTGKRSDAVRDRMVQKEMERLKNQ